MSVFGAVLMASLEASLDENMNAAQSSKKENASKWCMS